jgi:hypothetical protein
MVLIMSITSAAVTALFIWHRLRHSGEANAATVVHEARRSAGIVNAISYAFAIILDAMLGRRGASYNTGGDRPRIGSTVREMRAADE